MKHSWKNASKYTRVMLAAGLIVAVASCSSTSGGKADGPKEGSNAPDKTTAPVDAGSPDDGEAPEETETDPVDEGPTTTESPESQNPVFSETYDWEDGISITVGVPESFTPGEYSAVDGAEDHLMFEVKIVNGTDANFDPSMFTSTLQSGNAEAESVYDSDAGIEGSPSTTLLAGREAVFKIGYGVSNPDDLVLEVSPDFEHDSAIFTS